MFKQIGIEPREYKAVLYKIQSKGHQYSQAYLKMTIDANPLAKKYLTTDIKLATSQLMVIFDPKIVDIAINFANLKINK